MWRFLKAVWRVTWGLVELAVVLYVLNAIKDRETSTTLADLFTPLLVANPFSAMRASSRR
jgi:hypothetical protein